MYLIIHLKNNNTNSLLQVSIDNILLWKITLFFWNKAKLARGVVLSIHFANPTHIWLNRAKGPHGVGFSCQFCFQSVVSMFLLFCWRVWRKLGLTQISVWKVMSISTAFADNLILHQNLTSDSFLRLVAMKNLKSHQWAFYILIFIKVHLSILSFEWLFCPCIIL